MGCAKGSKKSGITLVEMLNRAVKTIRKCRLFWSIIFRNRRQKVNSNPASDAGTLLPRSATRWKNAALSRKAVGCGLAAVDRRAALFDAAVCAHFASLENALPPESPSLGVRYVFALCVGPTLVLRRLPHTTWKRNKNTK